MNEQTNNTTAAELIPPYQWTNAAGEVLLLRCCDTAGKAYEGFQYPLEVGAVVEAPDWNPEPKCGGGLHGWPLGLGMGVGKHPDYAGVWMVLGCKPADVVDLHGKAKARRGVVRCVTKPGDWQAAIAYVQPGQIAYVQYAAQGAASSTGAYGAASSTGYGGAASSTGYGGAASSTGECGAAVVTGLYGRAQSGPYGCIALAWWDADKQRAEMKCAEVGDGSEGDTRLRPHVWYTLDESGKFVAESNGKE